MSKPTGFDREIFKNHEDYWQVAENIRDIYMSEGSLLTLLDFERVLNELDIYAFKNWELGELVQGPEISKYRVSCIFMWPYNLMPDPKGAKRLVSIGCKVKFAKSKIEVPVEVNTILAMFVVCPDTIVPLENDPSVSNNPCKQFLIAVLDFRINCGIFLS